MKEVRMEIPIPIEIIEDNICRTTRRILPTYDPVDTDPRRHSPDDLRILISPSAISRAIEHTRTPGREQREVGGVLVGYPFNEPHPNDKTQASYVVILDAIPALGAREGTATIEFTPQSWETVFREMDSRYEGLEIVGWYHSHPGYSIFFSGVDLESQQKYFRKPYHIALVLDPFKKSAISPGEIEYGFFRWKEGSFRYREPRREYGRLHEDTVHTSEAEITFDLPENSIPPIITIPFVEDSSNTTTPLQGSGENPLPNNSIQPATGLKALLLKLLGTVSPRFRASATFTGQIQSTQVSLNLGIETNSIPENRSQSSEVVPVTSADDLEKQIKIVESKPK